MKKRITEYLAYIDALLEKEDVDWEHEKEKHLVQIAFFAHERQVHLIVMALFALATVISILYLNFSGSLIIVALVFALLVLEDERYLELLCFFGKNRSQTERKKQSIVKKFS